MKLFRCKKCGALIIGMESEAQKMLDAMEAANKRAQNGRTRAERHAAIS